MIRLIIRLYWNNLLLNKVIVLEFFGLVFLILHPKNARAIKVKRHSYFWHFKLPMELDFILISIDLVEILVLQFQFNSFVINLLHKASLFWVGNAQKMTILTPYIMVMECEQTMLEWLLRTLSISSFSDSLLRSLILMCRSPIAIYTFLSFEQI